MRTAESGRLPRLLFAGGEFLDEGLDIPIGKLREKSLVACPCQETWTVPAAVSALVPSTGL